MSGKGKLRCPFCELCFRKREKSFSRKKPDNPSGIISWTTSAKFVDC